MHYSKQVARIFVLAFNLAILPLCGGENAPIDTTASFTPPSGWKLAESQDLPKNVKAMVVGKGSGNFPPSINLTTEDFSGTLKDYLKIVKKINQSNGAAWKDLGTIKTAAGKASFSQVDTKTEWGLIRMMHVILVEKGVAYIMTAAAPKEEFGTFYKDFFDSMRSLKISYPEEIDTR